MENRLVHASDLMTQIRTLIGNCMMLLITTQTIKVNICLQETLHFLIFYAIVGNLLSEPFLKLPSRRRYADYYREIKNPISLSRIRSKLTREDYGNLSELASDLSLMFENAKHYNRPDSKLFKDAVKLQKVMQTKVQELLADDDVGTK